MAAEFMSEEEINTMLSSVKVDDENTGDSSGDENALNVESLRYSDKIFKRKESPIRKFEFDYTSPVIKCEDISYNPPRNQPVKSDRVAVYTVAPYRLKK